MAHKACAHCPCCRWSRQPFETREAVMTDPSKLASGHDRHPRPSAAAEVGSRLLSGTPLSTSAQDKLTGWDLAYSLNVGIACLVTYWTITRLLDPLVDQASDFLGGMWAVVAVIFVFRDTRDDTLRAGL